MNKILKWSHQLYTEMKLEISDGKTNRTLDQCRLYLHWGPGNPQPNGVPRLKVFTGFPLQLIFAKVKAEN